MVTADQLKIVQSPITGLISTISTSVSVKLDETNYLQWHFLLQLMLEGHGIMGFVDGSNLCPPQSAATSAHSVLTNGSSASHESDEFKAWKSHDYALMLLLTATLSSSAISCVIGSKSSREMWVHLQNHFFLPSTKSSIIKLQSDLYSMKKGSDSVSQYLQRLKEARDELSVLGVTFDDEDFVIIALNGLPAKYNTFKSVIRGRDSIISLKDFRAQLLAEEAIVDCAPVECETKGSFFPLYNSQFHASFNGVDHDQFNLSSCQSSYGSNVDSYNGILGSSPSIYPSTLPPEITTCKIYSHKDHLAAHCSAQTTNSSITQDPNLQDQVRFSDSMESIETKSVMVNSFSHYLESSLPFSSTKGNSISASKQNDCDTTIILKTEEQPPSSVGAESSQTCRLHQICSQKDHFDDDCYHIHTAQSSVSTPELYDIQLGYHMRISDKGGGTKSTLIWLLWYTRYNGKIRQLGLFSHKLQEGSHLIWSGDDTWEILEYFAIAITNLQL